MIENSADKVGGGSGCRTRERGERAGMTSLLALFVSRNANSLPRSSLSRAPVQRWLAWKQTYSSSC